jgi:hypothetical protein
MHYSFWFIEKIRGPYDPTEGKNHQTTTSAAAKSALATLQSADPDITGIKATSPDDEPIPSTNIITISFS